MAKLVDALVSGASVLRHAGSSPVSGTTYVFCVGGEIGIHATLRG